MWPHQNPSRNPNTHPHSALSGITCSLTVSLRDIPRQGGPRPNSLGLSPLYITNIKRKKKVEIKLIKKCKKLYYYLQSLKYFCVIHRCYFGSKQ